MHLFRDEIVPEIETSDNKHHSKSDKDYDPEMEKDIIEGNDPFVRHERMDEDAPNFCRREK